METNSYRRQSTCWPTTSVIVAVCFGVAALLGSVDSAAAQNAAAIARAKQHYAKAKAAYKTKDFKNAALLYLKAFEEYPNPIFHYNVAESYKQLLDCPNTLHYYKRYLGASKRLPEHKRRHELEKRARELIDIYDKRCKEGGPGANLKQPDPPNNTAKKPKKKDPADEDPPDEDPPDDPVIHKGAYQPTKINTSVTAGPSFVSLGDNETPVLFSLSATLGYPLKRGKTAVDVGAAFTLTTIPWEGADVGMGPTSGTALLSSILANVGASYNINAKLSLRGEVGLGILIFSGLADGIPFIPVNMRATGALSSFNVRVAVGVNYALTQNIVVHVLPVVFAYSPAPEGLTDDITSLSRFELMFGLGYRM